MEVVRNKKIISIIVLVIVLVTSLMTLSSCKTESKSDNVTIQIWWYDYKNAFGYSESVKAILLKLEIYCKSNDIPIEIIGYGADTLAYDDYIIKRNAAMANGNMIIMEDSKDMHDIARLHADYSKLKIIIIYLMHIRIDFAYL